MALAIAILVVAALLIWFLLLTSWEKKQGVRVLGGARSALDRNVSSAWQKIKSGEATAAFKRHARLFAEYMAHEFAHVALVGVRVVERFLTRAVRYLRGRRGVE